jgi:soluble lytic murein transglycosylase-like protein
MISEVKRRAGCHLMIRVLVLVGLAGSALPLRGELAVLAEGQVLKITAYRLEGERVTFELPSGGSLVLPLSRVERIVDDEIVDEAEAEPMAAPFVLEFPIDAAIPPGPFGELIFERCREHGLNPQVVSAMARVESAFRPEAVSPKGARGLLQVMPATAERFGISPRDLFLPEHNLEASLRYLSWLVDRFSGDARLVLAAYNAGEANVDRYQGVPPFRETRNYLEKIYSLLGFSEGAESTTVGGR